MAITPNVDRGSSPNTAQTSIVFTIPASAQTGDVILFLLEQDGNGTAPSTPSGWAQVAGSPIQGVSGARESCYIYIVRSSDVPGTTTYTFSWTTSDSSCSVWEMFRGVDSITPQDVAATNATFNAGLVCTLPTLTTVTAGAYIVGLQGEQSVGDTHTAWINSNERVDIDGGSVYDELRLGAGATGSKAITLASTNTGGGGFLVALRPASAPGAPAGGVVLPLSGLRLPHFPSVAQAPPTSPEVVIDWRGIPASEFLNPLSLVLGLKLPLAPQPIWTPAAAPGQITVPVVQASETDLAQAITSAKRLLLAAPLETDLSQALSARKALTLGQTTETDLAQALAASRKLKLLGQASETDTAQTVSRLLAGVVQAFETDLAQPISIRKTKTIGQTSETDIAQPVRRVLAQVSESDFAFGVARIKSRLLVQPAETDLAQPIAKRKLKLLVQASETELAQPIIALGGGAAAVSRERTRVSAGL